MSILVGIDVGGTFTDFVVLQDGHLRVYKLPTTPQDQSRAIVDGLQEMGVLNGVAALEIVHGTTAATNALLERRGARTALLTTAGFADILEIGRQNRPHLYKLHQQRPPQLVPAELRFEVVERLDVDGNVLTPLDDEALAETLDALLATEPESAAICLLFSYRNPDHERRVADALGRRAPDLLLSLSSEVLPEYREYERTSTTAINAYVRPLVDRYMRRLSAALPGSRLRIMQSNGGAIGAEQAGREPAHLVLSGPAGGVVGAFALAAQAIGSGDQGSWMARSAHFVIGDLISSPQSPAPSPQSPIPNPNVITFDMGGTSTDVALCPGQILRTAESEIAGLPLRLPVIDIHTVGAGGGSLAYVDPGGGLHVGPQSAGAIPGPVCYGRGGVQPTVTDANLVLGRLDAGQFLGGTGDLHLDVEAAVAALTRLGAELGALSAQEAALGVIRVANAVMERALRRVSVERGYDPKEFIFVPFGGAGPLHACELAAALGIRRILLPPHPGVLSALGLLMADVVHENAQAILTSAAALQKEPSPLQMLFAHLSNENRAVLHAEGIADPQLEASLDMRYRGQSYELTVALATPISSQTVADAVAAFHALHAQRYGYASAGEAVEVVTLRVQGIGPGTAPEMRYELLGDADPGAAHIGVRPVWFHRDGAQPVDCYLRPQLQPGNRFSGPAMIYQFDTTIVVPPGWNVRVDGWRNLWIERGD
ncbi:MAG: hydantoinase/oxoprolinase family protein [Caldilineaceae bacterium]|nr:hydantoinase/oxoprolinase family protein [Caldilineaceae bacterium]